MQSHEFSCKFGIGIFLIFFKDKLHSGSLRATFLQYITHVIIMQISQIALKFIYYLPQPWVYKKFNTIKALLGIGKLTLLMI